MTTQPPMTTDQLPNPDTLWDLAKEHDTEPWVVLLAALLSLPGPELHQLQAPYDTRPEAPDPWWQEQVLALAQKARHLAATDPQTGTDPLADPDLRLGLSLVAATLQRDHGWSVWETGALTRAVFIAMHQEWLPTPSDDLQNMTQAAAQLDPKLVGAQRMTDHTPEQLAEHLQALAKSARDAARALDLLANNALLATTGWPTVELDDRWLADLTERYDQQTADDLWAALDLTPTDTPLPGLP